MINFNGYLQSDDYSLQADNRGLLLGDGVFETMKVIKNSVLYLEDHYFRLMSAMRIVRMEIPMNFTMEYFEQQILATTDANKLHSARVRFTVFRNAGGNYLPQTNDVSYVVSAVETAALYQNTLVSCEVDLYKDFYVPRHLLSNIKTTNRMLNVTASIYASENDLQNCLLINDAKNVVESVNGNLFMRMNNQIYTPPLNEGCLNGVMRKQILNSATAIEGFEIVEKMISPFDLQKADELFFTNVILGVQSITKYRKKEYTREVADKLLGKFNSEISRKLIQ